MSRRPGIGGFARAAISGHGRNYGYTSKGHKITLPKYYRPNPELPPDWKTEKTIKVTQIKQSRDYVQYVQNFERKYLLIEKNQI